MTDPIVRRIEVPCPPADAFRIFTEDMDRWWPKDRNSLSAGEGQVSRAITLEPRAGGPLVEVGHDGTRHDWGRVTTWDPPHRLSLTWHPASGPETATEVDITFAQTDAGTRVELTHAGWERLPPEKAGSRDSYAKGWVHVFDTCFAGACRAYA